MSRMAMRWSREDGDDVTSSETDAAAGEVDESPAEVESAAGEVQEGQDVIDEGEAAIGEAEQIQDTLEEAVENGESISDTTADLLQIQTESINRRLGLSGRAYGISAESLKRRRDPRDRARVALESIGDTLGNAWETIKKWFKKLWTSIKNFYKSIFDANYKLIKRAEALKAKKFSSKDEDTDDIEDSSIYVGFAIDGSFKSQNVIDILKNHELIVQATRALTEKAAETVKNIKADPSSGGFRLMDNFSKAFNNNAQASDVSKYDGSTDGVGGIISGPLIDGMKMGAYVALEKDYGSKGDKSNEVGVVRFFHSTDPDADDDRDDVTIETASIENCRKICTSVIELAKAMEALAKNQKKIESIEKALDSEFDKWAKMKQEDRGTNAKYQRNEENMIGWAEAMKGAKDADFKRKDAKTTASDYIVKSLGSEVEIKLLKGFGSLVASSNTASLKYGYKAGVKALNYVAKSQSKFKKV